MKQLKIIEYKNRIGVFGACCFSPEQTFECGQCFRFERNNAGEYEGIASSHFARILLEGEAVVFRDSTVNEVRDFWIPYLDLERDYEKIVCSFPENSHISTAAHCCSGIHILKQDPWETLCSFIISQNNNIPRIKKIVKSLCENFGEKLDCGGYSFPDIEKIAAAGVEGLSIIKSGFRAKYIIDAAEKVAGGKINLETLKLMTYEQAKAELIKIKGVGEKVASCVTLFGLGFLNAFPVDVWIKRVLQKYYGEDFDIGYFGEYAGIAQQYLFHYERGNKKFRHFS